MQEIKVYIGRKNTYFDFEKIFHEFPQQVQEHITRYQNSNVREDSILAYYLLALILKKTQKFSLNDIDFTHPKPAIDGIHFSLSHSNGLVACCISDQPVGVDVERIKNVPQNVVHKIIDSNYSEKILNNPDYMNQEAIRWWTVRESIGKYLGTGITDEILSLPINRNLDSFSCEYGSTTTVIFNEYALAVSTKNPSILSILEIKMNE